MACVATAVVLGVGTAAVRGICKSEFTTAYSGRQSSGKIDKGSVG